MERASRCFRGACLDNNWRKCAKRAPIYGVGIDVHSRFIQVCVLAQLDNVIGRWEAEYATTWEQLCEACEWVLSTLSRALGERAPTNDDLCYTLESTGCYHFAIMRAWLGNPHLVNP